MIILLYVMAILNCPNLFQFAKIKDRSKILLKKQTSSISITHSLYGIAFAIAYAIAYTESSDRPESSRLDVGREPEG